MGRALKFYATIRIECKKVATLKTGAGIVSRVKVIKNKVAPPFGEVDINIASDGPVLGIDSYTSLLTEGFELGMFGGSKGWYEIEGKKYRLKEAIEYLLENPDKKKLYDDTLESLM